MMPDHEDLEQLLMEREKDEHSIYRQNDEDEKRRTLSTGLCDNFEEQVKKDEL